jgi:hypothetical protein
VIVAGIDEAGYGPVLGPLTVGLTAFRGAGAAGDLWEALGAAVSRRPLAATARDGRVAVCDSKRLFQRSRGDRALAALETTALAFSTLARGAPPATLTEFVAAHAVVPPGATLYDADLAELTLPLAAKPAAIAAAAARLDSVTRTAGIEFRGAYLRVLVEDEYNAEAERLGSKARALFHANVDLLARCRAGATEPLRVACDRHGGRMRYRELLAAAFPFERIAGRAEAPGSSSYEIGVGASALEIDYTVGRDRDSLPTALASIFAKYCRELYMTAFNRFFARRVAGIEPTAGYWTDGQRFLADLEERGALNAAERARIVRRR